MNDHQVTLLAAALSTGGPILAVLIGILVNNRQIDSLRREMETLLKAIEQRLGGIEQRLGIVETDLKEFYKQLGRHDKAIALLGQHTGFKGE